MTKEASKKRANPARRRRGAMAFLIASLMASTLTEPTLGVGFGRGCEGAIVDGAGREGVAAVQSRGGDPRRPVTLLPKEQVTRGTRPRGPGGEQLVEQRGWVTVDPAQHVGAQAALLLIAPAPPGFFGLMISTR